MGSVCCVAARDKTIINGSGSEHLHRNIRYSPTWSFRWDNRGRVAGEETSISWFSDGISRNGGSDIKYDSTYPSEEGRSFESVQRSVWQKSPSSEGNAEHVRTSASDQSISRNISMDVSLEQVKESTESPAVLHPSPIKLPLSLPSTSSLTSPSFPSQNHHNHASLTPSMLPRNSPGYRLLRQVSDSRIPGSKSPNCYSASEERPVLPPWGNESTRGSPDGSSDSWSMYAFSELMATSHRERWSFDSESLGFNSEKIARSSGRISAVDLRTCSVCLKLLSERTTWSMGSNEIPVAAVLICGHVYHAECLETLTPETNKYDPACPVCTFGEKQTHELSEKALRVELDLKARNIKRSRNRVVNSDLGGSVEFGCLKDSGKEGKGPKMGASSSMKGSLGKPFLRRHFSFGSKGTRSLLENHSTKKKGFFWAKSSRE